MELDAWLGKVMKKYRKALEAIRGSDDAWEYKILYEDGVYKIVEDYLSLDSWAETSEEADTLEELERQLVDEFFAKIKAIRNYGGG